MNRSTEDTAARSAVFACSTALKRGGRDMTIDPDANRLLCAGSVSAGAILRAVEAGADRVLVVACSDDACRHHHGARIAREQVRLARRLLGLLGFNRETITLELVDRLGESRHANPEAKD